MSIEKVRRYYFDLSVCGDVKRFEDHDAGYVEYADVAGLVVSLQKLLAVYTLQRKARSSEISASLQLARKELARWQS